jgi:ElaB/YqjD/DUF883 family membrane-anchored ribosome-binding protein
MLDPTLGDSIMAERDPIRDELKALKEDFAKLHGDVAELVKAVRDTGGAKAHAARDSLEEELRRRRDRVRERLDEARATGRRKAAELEDEVTQHPFASLAAAFGVGFLLAKLMHFGGRH